MFARNVSVHLKFNMLSEYRTYLRARFSLYFANKQALGMKSRWPVPAEWM